MNQDEIAELKRQFAEHASWGFVSRYGRTGRILAVQTDDQTLEIATPRGTLHARVGADTNIRQTTNDGSRALTFEDLTPGTLVTVDGATGTQENSDAGDIEVVPGAAAASRELSFLMDRFTDLRPSTARGSNGPGHRNGPSLPEPQGQDFHETAGARTSAMFNNPQSPSWKALGLILLLAAAAGFVLLNLLIFDIPFEIPLFLWKTAVVPVAICGAAGFMMLRETGRIRQDD